MYCTQCTSRQVLLICTQRLGWGFVRPGRTHTHGCLRSHATYLMPHTLVHCHYSMWLECYVWAMGHMRACVISRNIVVNPQWYELTCIAHSAQVVKCCVRSVLAGDSCVLDAHTRMGVCVPTPHI